MDEEVILARLNSPVYGAILQALTLSQQAVGCNAAAARILESDNCEYAACADVTRLALSAEQEQAFGDWPHADDPFFMYLREHRLHDIAFHPRQLLDPTTYGKCGIFVAIESLRPIADSFCLTAPLTERAWCAMIFLRCGEQPTFTDLEIQTLQRLKPAISRLIRGGYERQLHGCPSSQAKGSLHAFAPPRLSPDQLMAKLSDTERRILDHLIHSPVTERQIGQLMHRSPHTIHVHVKNIYRKFVITSRRELEALFQR